MINKLLVFSLLACSILGFFSQNSRKCWLKDKGYSVGELFFPKIPHYELPVDTKFKTTFKEKIEYEELDFIVIESLTFGGSGEVFLVEQIQTNERRILKRFLKEDKAGFQLQNMVLNEIGQEVKWHRKDNSTMISYPLKNAKDIDSLYPKNITSPQTFLYKALKDLQRYHKMNIIHNDIKPANILAEDKTIPIFIDWNIGFHYYTGVQCQWIRGTIGYIPPEVLLKSGFLTPKVDVWTMGISIYKFMSRNQPYPNQIKGGKMDNNTMLDSIVALVGCEDYLLFMEKYKLYQSSEENLTVYQQCKQNPLFYDGVSFRDRVYQEFEHYFTDDLVDLLEKMIKIDPQQRITISEAINHPYFDSVIKLPPVGNVKNRMIEEAKSKRKILANNLKPPLIEEEQVQK